MVMAMETIRLETIQTHSSPMQRNGLILTEMAMETIHPVVWPMHFQTIQLNGLMKMETALVITNLEQMETHT